MQFGFNFFLCSKVIVRIEHACPGRQDSQDLPSAARSEPEAGAGTVRGRGLTASTRIRPFRCVQMGSDGFSTRALGTELLQEGMDGGVGTAGHPLHGHSPMPPPPAAAQTCRPPWSNALPETSMTPGGRTYRHSELIYPYLPTHFVGKHQLPPLLIYSGVPTSCLHEYFLPIYKQQHSETF